MQLQRDSAGQWVVKYRGITTTGQKDVGAAIERALFRVHMEPVRHVSVTCECN